jgi:thioredoxin 1
MQTKKWLIFGLLLLAGLSQPQRTTAGEQGALPRLLDLGADKCVPCKMMAPILEKMEKEYTGRMDVHFIDVWKDPDAAKPYGVRMIPTQIFYGTDGQELFRHQGFYGKEEILAKWKELGYDFN